MSLNNKTKYVTMFSVLIASLLVISISETHSAFADTPIDTTDYFGQALKIFNQQQKISSEASSLQQQIADLKASSTADTTTINSRIVSLQQQLDADNNQISSDAKEIKRLEALNIKSYQVDPQTEKKLLDAEKAIHDKYIGTINTYDNPVQLVYADFKHRTIVVILDQNQVKGSPESLVAKTVGANGESIIVPVDAKTLQSIEPTKDVPIDIQYGKLNPASCTSVYLQCTPIESGVSVSNIAVHTPNTLGYQATRGTATGFVIAKHTATESNTIVQPYTSNNVIGTVTIQGTGACDCAFVAANQASVNKIFSQEQYPIQNKIPTSQQTKGVFVWKFGIGTGLTMGTISGQPNPDTGAVLMNAGGGDSGSPLFAYNSQGGINLYGMVIRTNGATTLYHPWDYIQTNIGAIPAP